MVRAKTREYMDVSIIFCHCPRGPGHDFHRAILTYRSSNLRTSNERYGHRHLLVDCRSSGIRTALGILPNDENKSLIVLYVISLNTIG